MNRHTRPARVGALAVCRVVAGLAVGLPLLASTVEPAAAQASQGHTRRVNVPYLTGQPFAPAIFWLGNVGMTSNYADVRVWHYDQQLHVAVHVMDRLLWHDPSPDPSRLAAWDAVSFYIDLAGNVGQAPTRTSYRFVKQLWNSESSSSRAVFRGDGSGWVLDTAAFTASDGWRGNYPNDTVWDDGWVAEFQIPFASLGLAAPPPPGTVWGLGVAVHDRDDAVGTPILDQVWPEAMQGTVPATWGQLHFGRPVYTPPTTTVAGTTLVRQGLNGAVVPDAAVGGHTICGGTMNAWTEWGNANYSGYTQFNIQNQWDISDFMCFSKYYVTFPLTPVPSGKSIVSARVTLNFFGNAGYAPGDAKPSAINALTVGEDWGETAITWNTAPYAVENVSVTWVNPVDASHPPGPYAWDVSAAVAEAYGNGEPLRLAFYSTDGDYHSGKYFFSSDSDDWGGTVRPTLEIQWGVASQAVRPAGDYDGDGKADIGVFRPGTGGWYSISSSTGVAAGRLWGNLGDAPVPADYDGDHQTDLAVFRPSGGAWYIVRSSTGAAIGHVWGNAGDVPVPADYDGDGKADIAVFRPSTGGWYIVRSSTGVAVGSVWGNAADLPVPADYDGDGKADVAVFRPTAHAWYLLRSSTGTGEGFLWGDVGDVPVFGDYDGDGKADSAVFRPAAGAWYIRRSAAGSVGVLWGTAGDLPV